MDAERQPTWVPLLRDNDGQGHAGLLTTQAPTLLGVLMARMLVRPSDVEVLGRQSKPLLRKDMSRSPN